MIRIAISQAAFDAIAATLPLGSVSYEAEAIEGETYVWLAPNVVNRLRFLIPVDEKLGRMGLT